MLSCGHKIVSCSLRRGCRQNRRRDLHKAVLRHRLTKCCNHLAAKNDILLHFRIAKIQITIFQTGLFICLAAVIDFERKVRIAAASENRYAVRHHLDLAGRLLRILGASLPNNALYGNGRFLGDRLKLIHHVFVLDHDLCRAVEITKNGKSEIGGNHTKIFQPAGQLNLFAGVTDAELSAGMST